MEVADLGILDLAPTPQASRDILSTRTSPKTGRQQCIALPAWVDFIDYMKKDKDNNRRMKPAKPGERRDLTSEFEGLRAQYRSRRADLSGPRIEWLERITTLRDQHGLARFVEIGRAPLDTESKVCARCEARIVIDVPQSRRGSIQRRSTVDRQGSRGSVAAAPSLPEGVRLAKACQVCMRWMCQTCCTHRVDLAPLAGNAPMQARAASPRGSFRAASPRGSFKAASPQGGGALATELECCIQCHSTIDALRWRHEEPLAGLSPSAASLVSAHAKLAEQMTSVVTHMAQVEGLLRLAESTTGELPDEFHEALQTKSREAKEAQLAIEASVRAIGEVVCPPPPCRDGRIREALMSHGKKLLLDQKPRVAAAAGRARSVNTSENVSISPLLER